jgi:hypothetical protein
MKKIIQPYGETGVLERFPNNQGLIHHKFKKYYDINVFGKTFRIVIPSFKYFIYTKTR